MRRIWAAAAAAMLTLSLASVVAGWGEIGLTAECAPDENTLAWKITLPAGEDNYLIDWSFDASFATFTTADFGTAGQHQFTTPRGGPTLFVRWSNDHDTTAQAAANEELCNEGSASPSPSASVAESVAPSSSPQGSLGASSSPEQSVAATTGTPVSSPEQSVAGGTGTPGGLPDTAADSGSSITLLPIFLAVLLATSLTALTYVNVAAWRKRRS